MQITRYLMAIIRQLVLLLKYVLHAKLSFIEHNHNYHDVYESCLTPCLLGILTCIFCRLLFLFFNINFFERFFQEYHQSVKQFGARSVQAWYCVQIVCKGYQQTTKVDKELTASASVMIGTQLHCLNENGMLLGSFDRKYYNKYYIEAFIRLKTNGPCHKITVHICL